MLGLRKPRVLEETRTCANEVAPELGVHPDTVRNWMRRGILIGDQPVFLESFPLGGRVWTSNEAVERFLAAMEGEPAIHPAEERKAEAEQAMEELKERKVVVPPKPRLSRNERILKKLAAMGVKTPEPQAA